MLKIILVYKWGYTARDDVLLSEKVVVVDGDTRAEPTFSSEIAQLLFKLNKIIKKYFLISRC